MFKLILNDYKKNKLVTFATICFMAISAMLFGITLLLFGSLKDSMARLMTSAVTPNFLQMHAGDIDVEKLEVFANEHAEVKKMQICGFLNLENATLSLGDKSLSQNMQDNGLCVQNEYFDFLLDMEGNKISANPGEVYVPICYREEYAVSIGDVMRIGDDELIVAGFLRDSQMNSMMASSKRFLVNESDYRRLSSKGEEEYLIEFSLLENADVNAFSTAYLDAALPGNGPTITLALIKLMNALSDGILIFVILFVSVVVLFISIFCIRYILLTSLEKDKKDIGFLKAVGISSKSIRKLYYAKFLLLSFIGVVAGYAGAYIFSKPLNRQMEELYGKAKNLTLIYGITFIGCILVELIILFFVYFTLKSTEKMSVLEALYGNTKKKRNKYFFIGIITAAAIGLMILPQNIASTLSSADFVTYMGIGDSQIRIDIRQTDNIEGLTDRVMEEINKDDRVEAAIVMNTAAYRVMLNDGQSYNMMIEMGNHKKYPVSYSEGTYPCKTDEIALSAINAKELGVKIGDEITICREDQLLHKCRVCGIYSDITNGGKTAKACLDSEQSQLMWTIIYLNLKDENKVNEWISEYQNKVENWETAIKITDISSFVLATYGQTIYNMKKAAFLTVISAALILFVVMVLFLGLTIWQERKECSLKKALGFTTNDLITGYLKKVMIYIGAGIICGLFLGMIPGQLLAGILISSLGASGFTFIINPFMVYLLTPGFTVIIAIISAKVALSEIKKIKAYECCVGRE